MDFPEAAEKIIAANSQVRIAVHIKDMVDRFTFCHICSSHFKGLATTCHSFWFYFFVDGFTCKG